jgi:predicted PhzF superfamily epimerase YddE/YHI9
VLPPTRAEATWRLRCFTPTVFEAFGAGGRGCYLVTLDPLIPTFFNPVPGIPEDPATGSAAGPLAAFLIADKLVDTLGRWSLNRVTRLTGPVVSKCGSSATTSRSSGTASSLREGS